MCPSKNLTLISKLWWISFTRTVFCINGLCWANKCRPDQDLSFTILISKYFVMLMLWMYKIVIASIFLTVYVFVLLKCNYSLLKCMSMYLLCILYLFNKLLQWQILPVFLRVKNCFSCVLLFIIMYKIDSVPDF